RQRHKAIERGAHAPPTDDRRDLEITIAADVRETACEGRAHGASEAPSGAGEDRAAFDLGARSDAHDLRHIFGGDADAPSTRDADRGPERGPGRDQVPGGHRLTDRGPHADADRQRMRDAPVAETPAHALASSGSVSSEV